MATIKVRVNGEIATNLTPEVRLVCQNDKYDVEFEFDESWANSNFKTALFIYNGNSIPVPFDREQNGNVCKIPALYDTQLLHIGVKSDDVDGLHTSTPARAGCLLSANDIANGEILNPTPSQYDEIIALLNKYIQQGLTEEQVREIVGESELNTRKQLVLGAEGVVEEKVYNFTVENAESFLEYRTNLTKFLVDLNLPISGDLDTKKEVAITFGDTTYYVYNILKGMEHATIGDLHQVDKYNNETGYRFITEMTFFQTSDIVGFAIIPTVSFSDILALDSDEMDNYAADGGLTQGQLAVCKQVITNGYTEGALYRYKITYPNTYEWEELSSGKIVDSDTITVMAEGKAVSLHLNAELVADIQRALKIPMSAPSSIELIGVDNTKSQVGIEIGGGLKIEGNTLSATGNETPELTEYVKFTDYANGTTAGVVYTPTGAWNGIYINKGIPQIIPATKGQIDAKTTSLFSIVPSTLDYAVKVGLTTNTETLTDEEKASACDFVGAVKKLAEAPKVQSVYGVTSSGEETRFPLNGGANENSICFRNANGQTSVATPTADAHAANRGFVVNLPDYLTLTDEEKAKWRGMFGATKFYVHFITTGGPSVTLVSTRKEPYLLHEELTTATLRSSMFMHGVIANMSDIKPSGDGAAFIEESEGVYKLISWDNSSSFQVTYFNDTVTEL